MDDLLIVGAMAVGAILLWVGVDAFIRWQLRPKDQQVVIRPAWRAETGRPKPSLLERLRRLFSRGR